ncbi:kinesin-like protein KIF14 [Centruroides sculpturatus]|uniref:kinesin-like protein KIF14 n=1 Tax=Centruroides sculpturatus TaxID=218467 RepID=UPI000C6CEFB0|nr:kinesin-like protein KIF14 [Centruroides sculpturatus]
MNDRSSRSHSIFTINLIQIKNETTDGECHTHETTSHINLVDLAGSERIAKSETSEERLKEGVNINKSLLTLGKVIAHLVERGSSQNNEVGSNLAARKHIFVPYRESTLTWLLKDSLGGNSRTAMLATVSPCNTHIEETLSTLRFARQTSKIVNVVRINDDPKARLIKELKAEIEKLRSQHQGDDIKYFMDEIAILKSQLQETQALLDSSKKNWEERLQQTEKRKEEEKLKLKKVGIALKMEGVYPSLINLNDDPQLSETLLYVLKPGITKVGRLEEQSTAEIQLHGRLIASNHCVIKNEDRLLTITPNKDALVYINGQLIIEITKLQHCFFYVKLEKVVKSGNPTTKQAQVMATVTVQPAPRMSHRCVVIMEREHFFRVNNPFEEEVLPVNSENRDFEYAYQELISVQESKLQEEIGKCRQKRCSEILEKFENLREEIELSMQKSFESVLESENDEHDLGTELQSKKSDIKEFVPYSSDFLDKITEMFNDVSSDLDNWKSKLDMTLQTGIEYESQQKQEKVGSLYQLSVRLKEANELTKELGTDIVLNRCDVLTNTGLELAIKVHSVNHNIATFWSLETFEERLERLRKLVQDLGTELQSKKSDIKEFVPYSSDFLDKITEMFNDVSSDLDNWKSKLDMTLQTGIEYESQQKQEKVGSLYQLSVRLKEANELTKELGTDIVLNRCDVLTNTGLELAIKVHSVNHNIATFWSLETFEERLERLRKLVQEFSSDKNAFCEVFEATDIWESQDEIPINILSDSKCDLKNIQKRLTQSLSSTGSSDMVFSFSDFHRSLNESLEPSSSVSSIFLITESCRSQLTKAIDMDHPLSLLNQAVLTCSNIWQQINKIKDQELFKNKGDTINLIIILTSDIRCLRSIISGWICIYINEDVPNWMRTRCINSQVANLKKILLDLEKVIVFIFQGMGKNLENLINQSIDMAQHTICSLITNFGEMSIVSSDTLHASVFKKINEKLSNNMLECAVDFIKKLCQISFEEIEDYELQYNSIIEDSFFSTLKEPWLIFSAAKHATIKLKEYLNLFCFNKEYEIKDDLSRFYSFAKDIARHIAQMTDGIVDFLSAIDLMFKGNSHGDALNLTKKNLVQLIYSFDKHCQWSLKLTEKQLEEKQKEIIQALQLVSTAIDGQLKDISLLMNGTIFQPGENNIQDNSDMPSQISGSSSVFALSSFFTSQLEDVIDI